MAKCPTGLCVGGGMDWLVDPKCTHCNPALRVEADRFSIMPHDHADKQFAIEGPGITLLVDYDDVDHDEVDKVAKKIVSTLNKFFIGVS